MSQSTQKLKEQVTGQVSTTPYETLRLQLMQRRNDLSMLVGKNVDKFIQVCLTACTKTPELLSADRVSFMFACKQAALDGLLPDGKDAAFVIYNTKVKDKRTGQEAWKAAVQYLPMVRGLIKLLWETQQFTMVDAAAVYERDTFRFTRGDNTSIEHIPYAGEDDPGRVVAAYFIAKLKTGEVKREVMFRRDIERARKSSKNPDRGPWDQWYDQMAIKSVIHRAYKQLPGVPDNIEGVFERDMASTLSDGFDAEVLQIPEQAGGDPLPPEMMPADTVPPKRPDPATPAAQAEPAGAKTTNRASKAPSDPGPSQSAAMTMIDAIAAVGRGEHDIARDIARFYGVEAEQEIERLIAGQETK